MGHYETLPEMLGWMGSVKNRSQNIDFIILLELGRLRTWCLLGHYMKLTYKLIAETRTNFQKNRLK
jgi:hypothetical protein